MNVTSNKLEGTEWQQLADGLALLARPPGCGWATSRSGESPLAASFHQHRYGSTDVATVREQWLDELSRIANRRMDRPLVGLLGVPFDQGSYGPSGAAAGPLGIRQALEPWRASMPGVVDLGDVPHLPGVPLDEMLAPQVLERVRRARYGNTAEPTPVTPLSIHRAIVQLALAAKLPVLSLGGDHTVSASSMIGLGRPIALVHFDAHDDLSIGRDGLTLLHSSWISFVDSAIGLPVVVQIGVERHSRHPWIAQRLSRFSCGDLSRDPKRLADHVAQVVLESGCTFAYVSVDIDVIRSREAPATPLVNKAGVAVDEVVSCVERLGQLVDIAGADVVEVAPPMTSARSWGSEPTCVSASKIIRSLAIALSAISPEEALE